MHKPERSRTAAFDQTWPAVGSLESLPTVNAVSTLRVKLIGSEAHVEARAASSDGRTRPYPSLTESSPVQVPGQFPSNDAADDNVYWHDPGDRSYQPLAFAHTMPAIPIAELGLEDSGVREIMRLQLWLHPRDAAAPNADQRDGTPTMRVSASDRGPLARVWHAWEQQSPGMIIFTATVLCVVSALTVSLFAH